MQRIMPQTMLQILNLTSGILLIYRTHMNSSAVWSITFKKMYQLHSRSNIAMKLIDPSLKCSVQRHRISGQFLSDNLFKRENTVDTMMSSFSVLVCRLGKAASYPFSLPLTWVDIWWCSCAVKNNLTCAGCGNVSSVEETYRDFSLALPEDER